MGKYLLITDSDLDGVSCGILARLFLKDPYIYNTTIDDANDIIASQCLGNPLSEINFDNFKRIYITDLAINEQIAKLIDEYNKKEDYAKVTLIDHHKTSLWMNDYDWATVSVEIADTAEPRLTCGTELFWNHIQDIYTKDKSDIYNHYNLSMIEKCHKYVELVRLYDTFEWKTAINGNRASDMNALLTVYSRKEFISNIESIILDDEQTSLFSDTDMGVLTCVRLQKKKYFVDKVKHMSVLKYGDYNVGVLFAEQYISELGNWICENNPNVDFVAIILMDKETVSMRSTKDVDVSAIAKEFGGGGHYHASGFSLTNRLRNVIFEKLFTNTDNE